MSVKSSATADHIKSWMLLSILFDVSIYSTGKTIQDYQSQWTSSFLPFFKFTHHLLIIICPKMC